MPLHYYIEYRISSDSSPLLENRKTGIVRGVGEEILDGH